MPRDRIADLTSRTRYLELRCDRLDQFDRGNCFKTLYESKDYLDEIGNSPPGEGNQDCIYYEPYQFPKMIEGTKMALSSFHLNYRSLSSNWDAFYNLLCDLHNKEFSFYVIGVSEIFRTDRESRIVLPGYHNVITRCRNEDGRGGVGLFRKDSINFKVREDLSYSFHMFANPCMSKWNNRWYLL